MSNETRKHLEKAARIANKARREREQAERDQRPYGSLSASMISKSAKKRRIPRRVF